MNSATWLVPLSRSSRPLWRSGAIQGTGARKGVLILGVIAVGLFGGKAESQSRFLNSQAAIYVFLLCHPWLEDHVVSHKLRRARKR